VRALRHHPSSQSVLGLHHDALLPVLRCRVPAGAMDGPGRRAPDALRREALKVLPPSGRNLGGSHRWGAHTASHTRRPSVDRHPIGTATASFTATALEERVGSTQGELPPEEAQLNKTRYHYIDTHTEIMLAVTRASPLFFLHPIYCQDTTTRSLTQTHHGTIVTAWRAVWSSDARSVDPLWGAQDRDLPRTRG